MSIAQRLPSFFTKCRITAAPGLSVVTLCLPTPNVSGTTKSQRIISAATGFPTQSMKFSNDDVEFFLFMNLRAQYQWATHKMTSVSWVEATSIFNAALEKKKPGAFRKTPRALMEKLESVEKQVHYRKKRNDYRCEQKSNVSREANIKS